MAKKRTPNQDKATNSKPISSEKALEMIRNLTAEFFDHAILLVSRENDGETEFLKTQMGNHFAVKGMAQSYLKDISEDCEIEIEFEDE